MLYRDKYGPFNLALRQDAAIARAMTRVVGGRVRDFMPWPQEQEQEATLEGLMSILRSARKE